jgi:hypothetical protein
LTFSPALHCHYTITPAPLYHHSIPISPSVHLQSTTPALYYLCCPSCPQITIPLPSRLHLHSNDKHPFTTFTSLHHCTFTISTQIHLISTDKHPFTTFTSLHHCTFTISTQIHLNSTNKHPFTTFTSLHHCTFTISTQIHLHSTDKHPLPHSLHFITAPSLYQHKFTSTPPINIPSPHSLHFITAPSLYQHKFTSSPPSHRQHPSSPIYHHITTISSPSPLHNQKMPPFIMRHDLIYVFLRNIVVISHVILGYGVVVAFQVWKHQTRNRFLPHC